MKETLFNLGPYKVCMWNILVLIGLFIIAQFFRRLIHRSLQNYLIGANIRLEGKKTTWLRLLSQSIYLFATYFAVLSFKLNNENVSFVDFLNYKLIETGSFSFGFHQVILIIAYFFSARIILNLLKLYYSEKYRSKVDYNPSKEYVFLQISKYIIYVFVIILSVKAIGFDPSLFIGGSAAILVGLGLGVQDVFRDVLSGFVLLFEGSIKIGDVIELQDSKFKQPIIAKILKINMRTTQIETREGNVLMIPNAKLTQEYIENWSHGNELTRFKITIVVHYGADTELVSRLLVQAAMGHPKVKKSEPIKVRLSEFGERGLDFELLFWADQSWDINNYKSEIRFEIDRLFREYGLQIPLPQRHITIQQNQESNSPK